MLKNIAILMGFQLAGEALVTSLGLAFPGPLCGLLLLLGWLRLNGGPSQELAATSATLIDHLGLLFVPAGAAIVTFGPAARRRPGHRCGNGGFDHIGNLGQRQDCPFDRREHLQSDGPEVGRSHQASRRTAALAAAHDCCLLRHGCLAATCRRVAARQPHPAHHLRRLSGLALAACRTQRTAKAWPSSNTYSEPPLLLSLSRSIAICTDWTATS